ncbi:VOC family protein [Micromonospora sp. 4G55]|uniref:VOC family protein n=1 Tax=Micromonospora sp. 4G55 TaxID=2806102 RepID=UPI001EE4120F
MIGQLRSTVIDCPDPRALAGFYAELLGLPLVEENSDGDDWVVLGGSPGRPAAARLPEGAQPAGPGLAGPGAAPAVPPRRHRRRH